MMRTNATVTLTAAALFWGGGSPAAAQEAACGAATAPGLWMGGAPEDSDLAQASDPLSMVGMSVPEGGQTVALFRLGSPMTVRVEAAGAGPEGGGDPVLELYDAAGTMLVLDDDSGGDLDARAEVDLPAGDYCLAVQGFGGGGLTADLQVSRIDQPALTDGLAGGFAGTETLPPFVGIQPCLPDTPATPLGTGPIDSSLAGAGISATNTIAAVPYYRFTLAAPQPVTIRAENPQADPYLYVFDGDGRLLEENDDYDSLDSRVDFTDPLPPGSYCLGLRALSDDSLPVTLRIAAFGAADVAAEQYANGSAPPPADGSAYPVTWIGPLSAVSVRDAQVIGGRASWFALEVTIPSLLLITADEVSDSDPVIALFDAAGRLVVENDDANGTLNSEMIARVMPGRYMLSVRQYSANYRGVIRLGLQTYVPAP
jgi:hypothetical protein